jgi:hypothetical protein
MLGSSGPVGGAGCGAGTAFQSKEAGSGIVRIRVKALRLIRASVLVGVSLLAIDMRDSPRSRGNDPLEDPLESQQLEDPLQQSPPSTETDIAPRPLNPALPAEEARPPQPALPPLPPTAPEPEQP